MEPKWSQNHYKIHSKFDRNFGWIFNWCGDRFCQIFGVFWGPWSVQNECLARARCYFSENHVFQTRCGFGLIFNGLLTDFDVFLRSENPPKNQAKNQSDFKRFLMDLCIHCGPKWRPCWPHFRLQKSSQILPDLRRSLGAPVRKSRGQLPIRT